MASTAGDSCGVPCFTAAAAAFLDDCFLLPPSSSVFLGADHDTAGSSCFHLPSSGSFTTVATSEQDPSASTAAAERKPPRKRPRPSRRPPTTVLTTDASNFRAMVQEFTGFPAPPPCFACPPPPRLRPGGALLGADPSDSAAAAFQPPRSPHLKLPAASPHASLPNCTTSSLVLDALALFAKNNAMSAAAGDATPRLGSSSELDSSYGQTMLAGAVPFDDSFVEAAEVAAEGEMADPGHGIFSTSSPLRGGDQWHHRH